MQVSLEVAQGLERKLKVVIPAEEINQQWDGRIKELSRKIHIKGFRSGKVPLSVVKQRYGDEVHREVVQEAIQSSLQDALQKEELDLIGYPTIEALKADPGEAIEYLAVCEIYPEITLVSLDSTQVKKQVGVVAEEDISDALEKLRRLKADWKAVDRSAQVGDKIICDVQVSQDGQPQAEKSGEDVECILGDKQIIPEIEEKLVGVIAGGDVCVDSDAAGENLTYHVTVKQVLEAELPELDDKFCEKFGIKEGGLDTLRAEVTKNLEYELAQRLRVINRKTVLDKFVELNPVTELPKSLLKQETDYLLSKLSKNQDEVADHQQAMTEEEKAELDEEAQRQVHIALLMRKYISDHNITVDQERVAEQLKTMASHYADPQQLMQMYAENKQMMTAIESSVLEDQVVDSLFKRCDTIELSVGLLEFSRQQEKKD